MSRVISFTSVLVASWLMGNPSNVAAQSRTTEAEVIVVFSYDRNSPARTFQKKVYDVRKGEYTADIAKGVKAKQMDLNSTEDVYVRRLYLRNDPKFQAGFPEKEVIDSFVQQERGRVQRVQDKLDESKRPPALKEKKLGEGRLQMDNTAPRANAFRVGQSVLVEWGGKWWDATILRANNGMYYITYPGWGREWDEWVGPSRIRRR
jgi:hypothetical protein